MAQKKFEVERTFKITTPNCFAYYIGKTGEPSCHALRDVYCLKEPSPCPFRKTREAAATSRKKAIQRLASIGRTTV
jgi:hypothetical protein